MFLGWFVQFFFASAAQRLVAEAEFRTTVFEFALRMLRKPD